jgi:hypothetical protein
MSDYMNNVAPPWWLCSLVFFMFGAIDFTFRSIQRRLQGPDAPYGGTASAVTVADSLWDRELDG